MRILLDTDMFCKLAVGRLLEDALRTLGLELAQCGRLAALPYMLRRGRLRQLYGPEICDELLPITENIPIMVEPAEEWLDRLTQFPSIDPGEAQLFASAAEHGMMMMSGDKRALRALKEVDEFPGALAGRIIVLEAILIALCRALDPMEIRERVKPLLLRKQL